ncbi:MAG: metalloprotease TldD, partial [Methylomonas sp.]
MESLALVKRAVLEPAGLQDSDIENIINNLLSAKVDAADIYFQSSHYESWVLESGIIKEGSHSIEQGAGVRAVFGEKTGFAYSDQIDSAVLMSAANNVKAIVRQNQQHTAQLTALPSRAHYYPAINPLKSLEDQDKIALMQNIDRETRKLDSRIEEVIISLSGSYEYILVANQDGALIADIRPLVRLNVSVIASADGRREQGSMGGGGRYDYRQFLDREIGLDYGREAVRQALVNLDAKEAPAGNMIVVLGSGWPGILLHEAIGHGLEGDFNRKGTSAFSGRVGERIGS